jgi:exosortase O
MNLPFAKLRLGGAKTALASALAAPLAANLLLLALWAWLYHPVYPYLQVIFTREEFRTNQFVLLAVLVLTSLQVWKRNLSVDLTRRPQFNRLALALALACSLFFLLSERFLDVNTLSASLFGLASYGLLGLWMEASRWRQGMPAALLLVSALPFGDHMQTFIGYPVRIFTAGVVREGLGAFGVHSISVDTILVFENGISQVDLPCSGVKSLWTGAIFLLAATWIERRPINARWLAAGLAFAFLLLAANLARVAVLVATGQVVGWYLLAEMLHVPLGVAGFAAACAAALWMLRWAGQAGTAGGASETSRDQPEEGLGDADDGTRPAPAGPETPPVSAQPRWLTPALVLLLVGLALFYSPRPESTAQAAPAWHFPAGLEARDWPLTPGEGQWLASAGVVDAERWRFEWQGQTGSMLLISSTTWRAHHRPERCFEVYGLDINNTQAYLVQPDFPVRLLSLGKSGQRSLLSAVYWFQSADTSTDDYAARIWSDLAPQRERWVLVTILFDEGAAPLNPESLHLYEGLREMVLGALRNSGD